MGSYEWGFGLEYGAEAVRIPGVPVNGSASGDVNGDGGADVSDAVLILPHIVGQAELTAIRKVAAKADCQINVSDAVAILRTAVSLSND